MRRARPRRGERDDPLVVPTIPGSAPESRDPVAPSPVARDPVAPQPRSRPRLRFVLPLVVLLATIFVAGILVSHGPKQTPAISTLSTTTPVPSQQQAASKPTALQLAHAAAVKLAAKLPVALESAGALRIGTSLYIVGGKARHGGEPTDAILRIALPGGRVRAGGHFLEPLTDAGTASRGGFLYLAGGWTGEKVATAVLRWAPGQDATVVARLPVGLRAASAVFVGGSLYVAGGSPRAVFVVDVHSGKVVRVATMPQQLRRPETNLEYLAGALARR